MTPKKGILAADESNTSADKRLNTYNILSGEEGRRIFREFLLGTPGIGTYLSGVILFDETIRQHAADGRAFVEILHSEGVLPGIKVDTGKIPLPFFPGEEVTEGLDDLGMRFKEYAGMGARFAKWRAVVKIGEGLPTNEAIAAHAHILARYAALAQEADIVPIVEPEVLLEGTHDITKSEATIMRTLERIFAELSQYRVSLPDLILKTSMALSGSNSGIMDTPKAVAESTVRALMRSVPKEVGGVVFLSGGQKPEQATENLRAICAHADDVPWPMTFSFARALQEPALRAWHGEETHKEEGRHVFLNTLTANAAALG